MPRKIWRKNFEIKRTSFLLAHEALESFYKFQKPTVGRNVLTQAIWINKGVDNIGTYFLKDELRQLIEMTLEQILNNTAKLEKVHKKTTLYSTKYFRFCRQTEKVKLSKLSNNQLALLYKKNYYLLQRCHGYSLCSTWFIDSDGEDLTNYLLNYVKNQIDKNNLKIEYAQAFSLLTTPDKHSLAQIENIEALEIIKKLKKDKIAKKAFLSKNTSTIEKNLNKINPKLRNSIIKHYKKWRWTPFTYIGPAYDLDYYLETWSAILRQKINIVAEIKNLKTINQQNKTEKIKLYKKLKIDTKHKRIFNLASEIVWLKAYRKDALFYGCYVMDILYKEIGKRFGLSLNQARHLTHYEVNQALVSNKYSVAEINNRINFFVIYFKNNHYQVLTKDRAKKFLLKQNFEKVKVGDVKELVGTPASSGRVKGTVKIINIADEMGKMNKNDIMVAHSTFPALVPAMKKAAAIVTDDGGLTCHAAIVARELKTPCVVGVKIATQVFKDGDKVEVDATNGVVKKIK